MSSIMFTCRAAPREESGEPSRDSRRFLHSADEFCTSRVVATTHTTTTTTRHRREVSREVSRQASRQASRGVSREVSRGVSREVSRQASRQVQSRKFRSASLHSSTSSSGPARVRCRSSQQQPRRPEHSVTLRVYDLTSGKAARWSPLLLGKKLKGVWHTGVVVYGFEYFYGDGVKKMPPQQAEEHLGSMLLRYEVPLGWTRKQRSEFERYLLRLTDVFQPSTYDLFHWNCNHFANACVFELLGIEIPRFILAQDKAIGRCRNGPLLLSLASAFNLGSLDSGGS